MKIVTTPMCEELLKLIKINNYTVSKNPNKKTADIIITLSETKIENNSIKIKLNTFDQIEESVFKLLSTLNPQQDTLNFRNKISKKILNLSPWKNNKEKYLFQQGNNNIKIKVHSQFLTDIISDMGFQITQNKPNFIVFPDYMDINENHNFLSIPSHNNVPKDPIKRAKFRYNFIEENICMKH